MAPLNDLPHIVAFAFTDENPKGFGLLQRDRVFDFYLDGVHYERRPRLWGEHGGAQFQVVRHVHAALPRMSINDL
jgi:glucan biosynthesis protein